MTRRMYSGVTMLCFTSTACSPELVDPGAGFNCVSHDGRGAGALAPVAELQAGTRATSTRIPSKPNKHSSPWNERLDIHGSPFLLVALEAASRLGEGWAVIKSQI